MNSPLSSIEYYLIQFNRAQADALAAKESEDDDDDDYSYDEIDPMLKKKLLQVRISKWSDCFNSTS